MLFLLFRCNISFLVFILFLYMRVRHARDYNVVVYKVGGQEHVYGPRRYTIEVIQGSDRKTKHQIQKSN